MGLSAAQTQVPFGNDNQKSEAKSTCTAERTDWQQRENRLAALAVFVTVFDDDAAEVADGLHEVLEGVVPLGGGLEDEHDALVGEAELEVADFADVLHQLFGFLDLDAFGVGKGLLADLVEEQRDVFSFEDDLAHGDERGSGGLGVLDEIFPAVGVVLFEEDGGDFFGDVAAEASHAVTSDKGDHVVFEGDEVIGLHWLSIVADWGVYRTY